MLELKTKDKIFIQESIKYPFFNDVCADEVRNAVDYIRATNIPQALDLLNETEDIIDDVLTINADRLIHNEPSFVEHHKDAFYLLNPKATFYYPRNGNYLTEYGYMEFYGYTKEYFELGRVIDDDRYTEFILHVIFLDIRSDKFIYDVLNCAD